MHRLLPGAFCALLLAALPAGAQLSGKLYVFDNGTGRDQKLPLAQQAELMRRFGYAGVNYTGTAQVPDMLRELDSRGLDLLSIYVAAWADGRTPAYDPGIPQAIRELKGRRTLILLNVQAPTPDSEERVTGIVREIADLAAASGLKVCLYPHYGFAVARIEDALRIAGASGRANVGVAFNLCHFLRVGDEANLKERLRQAMPRLLFVSINGADHTGDWDRLIQTLDRGEYDVSEFLRELESAGYRGPVALQCYNVKGDIEDNLARSMKAWRAMRAKIR
jgi:sugar phosphate isomerase/epimerase